MEKLPNLKSNKESFFDAKEAVKNIAQNVEKISSLMQDQMMTEPHMAYALLEAGMGHAFVQEYLNGGAFVFFDEHGNWAVDEEKVFGIIKGFEYDRDKDKTLVPVE